MNKKTENKNPRIKYYCYVKGGYTCYLHHLSNDADHNMANENHHNE